jgi:hypothetical protein
MTHYHDQLALDRDCRLYRDVRRSGVPRRQVAAVLGWTSAYAEAIRKRLERHHERNLRQKEYFITGTQVGNNVFSFWFLQLSETCPQTAKSGFKVLSMEEFSKLQQAQEALARFTSDAQLARNTVADLRSQLNAAALAVDEDGESAIMQGREPNCELAKQVTKITAALKAAQENVRHHDGAIAKQTRIIQAIEEKIFGHRHQAFDDAVSGDTKKLHRLIDELVATSLDIRAKSNAYGFPDYDPFPAPDRDGGRTEIRALQNGLYRGAQRLADLWGHNYVDCPYETPDFHPFPVPQAPTPPRDPIQLKIDALWDLHTPLQERYTKATSEERKIEHEMDKIRSSYRIVGGGFAQLNKSDEVEIGRLQRTLEVARAEVKAVETEWKKWLEQKIELEKQLEQKRAASVAA